MTIDYKKLNNDCVVIGCCGRAGPHSVDWDAPKQYQLYVQKDGKGAPCCIAIKDIDFAEFDPRHCVEGAVLVAEDYYFEVLRVISNY